MSPAGVRELTRETRRLINAEWVDISTAMGSIGKAYGAVLLQLPMFVVVVCSAVKRV